MNVTVVIPAYNEAPVIRSVVEGVRALGYQVLVVDDGSADDTFLIAGRAGAEVLRWRDNHGVGNALSDGIKRAEDVLGADIVAIMDADQQHEPADIPKLVAALEHCDIANGSRFLGSVEGMPWTRRALLSFVHFAMWMLSGVELTDPCCGMKAFRPELFRIRSKRMAWACEFLFRNRSKRIVEVPVTVRYTEYSKSKGQRSRDAFKVAVELISAIRSR